eukprot:TRINITY_DN43598_c0_g1_i1.p1 TRINITY_DN43598_c0_g1~~TRINITY_DN43598_c0_g1_i1.p1  ORF type:complete len:394 (+),score=109.99 TRINITY_DN43598_c0_g1_i1:98-1183(+)
MAVDSAPENCVVTGAGGLVGRRLVEMLLERGAKRVVGFDISPRPVDLPDDGRVVWVKGDLTKREDVFQACKGADCVWHIGALVGPYFPKEAYGPVNYQGSLHVIDACRAHGVRKIVMSSSPSTRFDGSSFYRVRGEELPHRPPGQFLEPYAETKAMGEKAVCDACDGQRLLTCAVSPHQVYGPRDQLFLPNLLKQAARLRIFGSGENEISMVYVDNYCHALILGEKALYPGSPALGKFYVVTDGPPINCWDSIDTAVTFFGYPSLKSKFRVPVWLLMGIAYVVSAVGAVLSVFSPSLREYVTKGKGPFRLRPFAIRMMTIHRSFDISAAERDLKYKPLHKFDDAWLRTLQWFKDNRQTWDK